MARKVYPSNFAENAESRYQEPPTLPAVVPLKAPGLEHVERNEKFAPAAAVLRQLLADRGITEREIGALRIEDYLARSGADNSRNRDLRDRLAKLREGAPSKTEPTPAAGALPKVVREALELRSATRPSRRLGRQEQIELLLEDVDRYAEAIAVWEPVVVAIREQHRLDMGSRVVRQRGEKLTKRQRAAQAYAASNDELLDFDRSFTAATGHAWPDDLQRTPLMRSVLLLGTERFHDSEVRQCGRLLEGMGLI
jgi:hypothetical protein